MSPKDIIWTEQTESLSVWCSSEDLVMVIGEHHGERQFVVTEKRAVLEGILSKAASKFSEKFPSADPTIDSLRKNNKKLASENRKLKRDLKDVTSRIDAVEKQISDLAGEERIIVLREITKEEAKDEIRDLFRTGKVLYYSDIAEELRIDLELVVEICQELKGEGEIELSDDSA